jgi:plasmid stabilization system protein ParE
MTLPVRLADQAFDDIAACHRWWAINRSREQADRWHDACETTVGSLTENPARCTRAAESESFPFEVRQLSFGVGRRPTHRVVFTIRPDCVFVLRVQHLAQQELSPDDL